MKHLGIKVLPLNAWNKLQFMFVACGNCLRSSHLMILAKIMCQQHMIQSHSILMRTQWENVGLRFSFLRLCVSLEKRSKLIIQVSLVDNGEELIEKREKEE
jgi:hypothetical protein